MYTSLYDQLPQLHNYVAMLIHLSEKFSMPYYGPFLIIKIENKALPAQEKTRNLYE